tara:strand:+ start:465 stop:1748 length:1284 start_codon:yes stop_codon:yes gene_type:complete
MISQVRMNLFVIFCLLAFTYGHAEDLKTTKPSKAGFDSDRLKRIDKMIQGCIDRKEVPGAVGILIKDGKIGYHKAFGWADIESKKPLKKDTLFRIASMSKLITTVAALQLFEKAEYNMYTELGSILPEFKEQTVLESWDGEKQAFVTQIAKKKIRMNQLFTHTSGIVYPIFTYKGRAGYMKEKIIDAWPGEDISLEENIKRLAGVPLAHEPGEGHTYGMNMDVLGRVIEVLDGRPFAKYMREELFRPLKMKDTGFAVPKNKWNRMPSVYTTKNGKLALFDESVFDEKAPNNKPEWWKRNPDKIALGGAGIISTAYDYARFLQMLVNDGELDGERILGRKTVDMISRGVHQSNPESSTASGLSVGVVINSEKHLHPESQGSFNGGGYFYTSFWVDPKEKFIGILLSQINPGYSQLAGNFKLMGYSALK